MSVVCIYHMMTILIVWNKSGSHGEMGKTIFVILLLIFLFKGFLIFLFSQFLLCIHCVGYLNALVL